jgi:hypothetical protein
MPYTYAQVYALARGTGLSQQQAIIATAIAAAESGLNPAAVGDTSLTNATWGPSVSLWQVRTLKADTGTGRNRDIQLVSQPGPNARAMYEISNGGRSWSPWSTYNDEKYRDFIAAATAAAGGSTGATPAPIASATYPTGQTVTVANGNSPFDIDVKLGPLSGPVEGLIKAAGPIVLGSLIVAGGVTLVIVGLAKAAK